MMIINKNRNVKRKLISAKEIMEEDNISYQMVNHYTNFGLLEVITRDGNARMYDQAQVRKRLAKISKLVSEGYSLRLIRKKLIGI